MGAFYAAESWQCGPLREAAGWGTGVFLDALRGAQVWLKLREKRLRVAGETGAPTPVRAASWLHFALEGAPLNPHPSSLTLVPPSSPDLREKLDPLVLQELLVLEVPR